LRIGEDFLIMMLGYAIGFRWGDIITNNAGIGG
jgi:hypothetical protein